MLELETTLSTQPLLPSSPGNRNTAMESVQTWDDLSCLGFLNVDNDSPLLPEWTEVSRKSSTH